MWNRRWPERKQFANTKARSRHPTRLRAFAAFLSCAGPLSFGRVTRRGTRNQRNHIQGFRIMARALTNVSNQSWPEDPGKSPGSQHQAVNRPDIGRPKIIRRKRRHGSKTAAVAEQNNERERGECSKA